MVTPGLYIRLIEKEQRGIFCSCYFTAALFSPFPVKFIYISAPNGDFLPDYCRRKTRGGGVFFFWGTVTRLLSPFLLYNALLINPSEQWSMPRQSRQTNGTWFLLRVSRLASNHQAIDSILLKHDYPTTLVQIPLK